LKLSGTHQLLVYADGGSIHTIRKNTKLLLIASKEIGSEVNAEKTKYVYGHVSRSERRTKWEHTDG
jgi:hypothetical protein